MLHGITRSKVLHTTVGFQKLVQTSLLRCASNAEIYNQGKSEMKVIEQHWVAYLIFWFGIGILAGIFIAQIF